MRIAAALALALWCAACNPAPRTVAIGLLVPPPDQASPAGAQIRDGALLAVGQWNAQGGVLGRFITPIIVQGACDPDAVVAALQKARRDHRVRYLAGDVCESASATFSAAVARSDVVFVGVGSPGRPLPTDENGATLSGSFLARVSDASQGRVGASFAIRTLGARSAYIMFDQDRQSSKAAAEAFASGFLALGGKIVDSQAYMGDVDKDYTAILAAVKRSRAAVVFIPDRPSVVNLVARQGREMGIPVPFIGTDEWDSPELAARDIEPGYYTSQFSGSDPSPGVQAFVKAYQERFGGNVPDWSAALSYEAVTLLLTAISAAGRDDPGTVRGAMETVTATGLTGTMAFDKSHGLAAALPILSLRAGQAGPRFVETLAP